MNNCMVVSAQWVLILTHSLYYHLCLFFLTSFRFSFLLIFLFVFSFLHNSVHNNVLFTQFFWFVFFEGHPCTHEFTCSVDLISIKTNQLLTIIISIILIYFTLFSSQIRLSDLIAARILRYTDFDTLIYTCAPEFDFMEKAVWTFFCFFFSCP